MHFPLTKTFYFIINIWWIYWGITVSFHLIFAQGWACTRRVAHIIPYNSRSFAVHWRKSCCCPCAGCHSSPVQPPFEPTWPPPRRVASNSQHAPHSWQDRRITILISIAVHCQRRQLPIWIIWNLRRVIQICSPKFLEWRQTNLFGVASSWARDALDQFAYNTKRETLKRPTIVQRFAVKVSQSVWFNCSFCFDSRLA